MAVERALTKNGVGELGMRGWLWRLREKVLLGSGFEEIGATRLRACITIMRYFL